MKKILLSPWTALITLALMLFIRIEDPSFVESIRLRYFDQLITSKTPTVSEQIKIVNIDDETIRQKGQFPFPRDKYAELIDSIYARNAGLVVFNVMMSEPDRFGKDNVLTSTIKTEPVVLPQVATTEKLKTEPPFRPGVSVIGGESETTGVRYESIQPNIPLFNKNAAGIGVVNTLPEIDGVTRRIPMVINSNGLLYPSISLETLRVASGDPSFQVKVSDNGIEAVRIPKFGKITTDQLGRIWVDWSSKPTEYSASNLPKDFGGSIVIVGLTAKGLNNPVATSTGSVYPHQLQAAVLDTIVSGKNIVRPDWANGAEILALIVLSMILLFFTRRTYAGLIISVVCIMGSVIGSIYLFRHSSILIDATAISFSLVLITLHAYGVKFINEFLQKQQIKKQFGTYLSPSMVERLQHNPDLLVLGGESRELSIMFTDVRGFTSISEHYGKDVQGLTKIMNRYMTAMTAKILDNSGTLDKYIGDAQMAFWNAPLDDKDHAKNAVKTALEMLGDLDEFNREITEEGVPAFGMGLGINTDTVVVGNMGSSQRFDYTCLGDGVNLASRLEGQSKPYGVRVVIGNKTYEQIRDEYYCLELDCIAVKGKKQGINIYTVLGKTKELKFDKADTQLHEAMLQLYRQQKFDTAIQFCNDLKGRFNGLMDNYYDNFIERCEEMKQMKLPDDWDGVYRATSK